MGKAISVEDGEYFIQLTGQPDKNPELHFGPLSTTLIGLLNSGYCLFCHFSIREVRRYNRKVKIQLRKGRETYKVGMIPVDEAIQQSYCLSHYIAKRKLHFGEVTGSSFSDRAENIDWSQEEQKNIDPFDSLMKKYPVTPKIFKVRNRTNIDYIKEAVEKL